MFTIEQILDAENSIVLVDSTIQGGHSVCRAMYNAVSYSQIDCSEIKTAQEDLEEAILVFSNKNTKTIPEVTREMGEFDRILGTKIGFLSKIKRNNREQRKYRKRKKYEDTAEKTEKVLKALQNQVYKLCQIARNAELRIHSPQYDCLIDMTKLIETALNLKKDTAYIYGEHEMEDTHSSDTDERVTATLFWLSMFSEQKPILITGDTDFVSLLGVIPRIIGAGSLLPYNREFREALLENPFKVYIENYETKEYSLKVDSSELRYNPEFELRNLSGEKNKKLEEEIKDLWVQFSKI